MTTLYEKLIERIRHNKPSVLITATQANGSTPGKPGFKMLASADGIIAGTVGGGIAEFHALDVAAGMIRSGLKFHSETLYLNDSLNRIEGVSDSSSIRNAESLPSICGGDITLLYELIYNPRRLYIFGAGHVGRALARMAKSTGFHITFFDHRPDILDTLEENTFDEKHCFDFSLLPSSGSDFLSLDSNAFCVILTHSHSYDLETAEYLLRNYSDMKYIGMIGSRRKTGEVITYLKNKYPGTLRLENLYSPVGLRLGGETPEEIAVSILSEIQAVYHGIKSVEHMRLDYESLPEEQQA